MPGVTKEQIARAKEWDLLSYLQAFEPQELRKCGGREYRTVTHDSLKISNGKWNWHSRGIGGRTALDYLIKVRGMDFVSAVETLCGERGAAVRTPSGIPHREKPGKPFTLPQENRCGTAAVSYLLGRGIDADVISQCIREGILYEARGYHNCVFVGKDSEGKARYACLRGIYGTFKNDVDGSDKRYSFSLPSADKDSPYVAVAESPVDALSIASLLKMQGEDWTKNHYLSLGGTAPRALLGFLHDHPAVTCVSLCLDNDRAGLSGMEKIREALKEDAELSRRIQVIADNPPPGFCGKDYNDLLVQKTAARCAAENREKAQAGRGGGMENKRKGDTDMAISDLLPRKAMGSKTRGQTLHDRLDYDQKEEKTKDGELVSSYMCCPETAAEEFEMGKLIYETSTGRSQPKDRDIIAYRIIQSFKPGEITPEEANKLGYELAMKFTKGKHQFVVSTHVDKAHIHNHVEFNSTNLDCDGKFNNYKNSSLALRRLNDQICREHGYSVIENPKAKGQRYQEKAAAKRGRSFKERLRQTIDGALPGCGDFEEFLSRMRAEGYEIKRRGKSLEFRAPGQENFTRSFRLGEDYTEAALKERIGKARTGTETKSKRQTAAKNVNLLVDIQAKMQAGKGKGYERWAKVFNLKEAAKTLNFLVENGVADYGELAARADAAGEKFDALSVRIRQLEGRMAGNAQLKTHIINYSKTREVYKEYKKSRHKKEYLAGHAEEIKKHEAAKAAFDALNGKPIPKVAQLSQEYAALLAEKKECYEEYKAARKEMVDYQTAKHNVDVILGLEPQEAEKKKETER